MTDPTVSRSDATVWYLYRIVKTNSPTLADFVSNAAKGRPIPSNARPEARRLWDGLSAYATEAQARRHAKAMPMLGSFLAELTVTTDSPVRIERTLGAGHYTIWGEPAFLLACVTRVVPVRQERTEVER